MARASRAAGVASFLSTSFAGSTGWTVSPGQSCHGEALNETTAADCRGHIDPLGRTPEVSFSRGADFTRCILCNGSDPDPFSDNSSDLFRKWQGPCPVPAPSPPSPPPPVLPGSHGYFVFFDEIPESDQGDVPYLDEAPLIETLENCHMRCEDMPYRYQTLAWNPFCTGFVRNVSQGGCRRLKSDFTPHQQIRHTPGFNTYWFDEYWVDHRSGPVAYISQSAHAGAGGDEIDTDTTAPIGLGEQDCWHRCESDEHCSCVTFQAASGKCWKRSGCMPESFEHIDGYDVFYKYTPASRITYDLVTAMEENATVFAFHDDIVVL